MNEMLDHWNEALFKKFARKTTNIDSECTRSKKSITTTKCERRKRSKRSKQQPFHCSILNISRRRGMQQFVEDNLIDLSFTFRFVAKICLGQLVKEITQSP